MDTPNPHLQPKMLKTGFSAAAAVPGQEGHRHPPAGAGEGAGCPRTSGRTLGPRSRRRFHPPNRSSTQAGAARRQPRSGEAVGGRGVAAAGSGLCPARPSCRRWSTRHASRCIQLLFKKNLQFCNYTQLRRGCSGSGEDWRGGRCGRYGDAREMRRKKGKIVRKSRFEQRAKLP